MSVWLWLEALGIAYLLGSIPTAYLAGRLAKGVDIRRVGDGNPGAANVWREVGPLPGAVVALVDVGKGAAAVVLAHALTGSAIGQMLAGGVAVVGHNWSAFLRLQGGRGAATALGVLLAVLPRATFPLVALALIPFFLTRSLSVSFAFVYIPLPLLAWWSGASVGTVVFSIGIPILVGVTHAVRTHHPLPAQGKGIEIVQ
ncbi:MAG: glycerol-3-phosphate acyltransferase [Dehalococcoidia bacterium]|nr:glycerol-3-phosphate acyltransferase [Dehalococcoidia bacterium]MDW8119752.1 glycerol-3-phosphate acyltransferase [Chloroflexota bacterium]